MLKILLTGANGFLGKIIFDELSKTYNVKTLGRKNSDYNCDLSSDIPFFNEQFDIIVHAAGLAHCISNSKKMQFYNTNVKGIENLLEGLRLNILPSKFVFISSVSVYGIKEGSLINENFPLLAKDAYGMSKVSAELRAQEWCTSNNVICTILRLPLLIGKNPPGNLKSMLKAIKTGYYFNIGGGQAKKSMVLAQDVARFIPSISQIGGIYNLTDGRHPSFYELSSVLSRKKNLNLPLFICSILAKFGDLIGDKAPLNTEKLKKITSDLTFDDAIARNLGWNSKPILEYLKDNDLLE